MEYQYLVGYVDPDLTLCDIVQRLHGLYVRCKNRTEEILQLIDSCTQKLIVIANSLLVYPYVARRHLAQNPLNTM